MGKSDYPQLLGELVAKLTLNPDLLFLKLKLAEPLGSQNQHLEFPKAYGGRKRRRRSAKQAAYSEGRRKL